MRQDKSLSVLLMVLFGISGVVIIMLAWIWPMLASEKTLATLLVSFGLIVALIQALMLKSPQVKAGNEHTLIKVKAKDET